jgi:hypothetical protein
MASLTLRSTTSSPVAPGDSVVTLNAPLSISQVDNNFISLNTGKLDKNNNLSDLADPTAARTNLGVDPAGMAVVMAIALS